MGKPLRVLLIEDSEDDSELLLLELKRVGYDVEFERVETEAEMRAMLSEKKWDLILSDYTLPNFSAPQALKTLKISRQDIPFIILSGTIEEDIALGALQAGANDFLVKGKFARLGPAIERELHEAEARRQSKLAEEQIKYHARLLRHINDAVIATNDQFRITAWNRSAERIYGWAAAEVMGRNIDEILRSGLSEEQQTQAKELLKERSSIRSERIHSNKNGQPVYVEENTIALIDEHNKITGYVSVNRDITERKKAEEAVLESEARYHHVLDAMMEGCQIIGFDWRYVYVNDVVVAQGKQTREELLNHTMMEVYPGIENTELFAVLRECMEQRKPMRLENPFTFPDGSLGWFELSIQPAREGIFILSTDITERKQAEEAVRGKTEEIKAMSQQLWQAAKLATMGELAASIAHELNNPLATVSLRVEMLQVQFTPQDPQSKSLQVIASEVKRMSDLVMNLLQFSRRSSSQISTINVNSELEDTLELVQYHLRKNSIVTIQELSPDIPLVQADRQQLRQVFLNLFTNAADAMPLGGMLTIRSWTEEKPDAGITTPLKGAVTRSLGLPASDRPQVFIEVSDSGEGIAPDTLLRIWEPFYTTKPEGKGTGLGLAICRRIIQEHSGTIDVFSEGIPGKGATVRLSLPAVTER